METVIRSVHRVLVAGLVLSLSTAGLYPCLVAGGGPGECVNSGQIQSSACCCGVEGGRCCTVACCPAPSPKPTPEQASPPSKPSDNRAQPLGLASIADVSADGDLSRTAHDGSSRHLCGTGNSTLIALSIRLNI